MRPGRVLRLPMRHPADLQALERALADARIPVDDLVALWLKTEGNGLGNDFTRPWAEQTCGQWLAQRLGLAPRACLERVQVMVSGGAEGVVSPHLIAVARGGQHAPVVGGGPRLVVGAASEPVEADRTGTCAHARQVAALTREAMNDAGIVDAADVHGVMLRAPSRPGDTAHGARVRATGALGIAAALNEIDPALVADGANDAPLSASSSRAFVVARPGDDKQQLVLIGNARGAPSPYRAAHTALADPLDTPAVAAMLATLGLSAAPQLSPQDAARVVALVVKSDPPVSGHVRGLRHTMSTDADIAGHRHARGAFAAAVCGIVGHGACFVGAGAEHQGPPDGGLVFAIARLEDG